MFNLIPREVRFFDLFERQGEHIIKAAALLHQQIHERVIRVELRLEEQLPCVLIAGHSCP